MQALSRWGERLLWVLFGVLLFAAVFYAEEDWRGARALERTCAALRTKGEPLTSVELFSSRDPVGNLATRAVFADYFSNGRWTRGKLRMRYRLQAGGVIRTGLLGDFRQGRECDLEATQKRLRADRAQWGLPDAPQSSARDILGAFARWDADFVRMREAIGGEGVYWPVDLDAGFVDSVPHLSDLLEIGKLWTIEGEARLANGEPGKAAQDFVGILDLADSIGNGSLLVSHLYAITLREQGMDLLWQGLHRHAWRESDLIGIEARLSRGSLFDSLVFAERGERIALLAMRGGGGWGALRDSVGDYSIWIMFPRLFAGQPSGWLDLDGAEIAKLYQKRIDAIVADRRRAVEAALSSKAVSAPQFVALDSVFLSFVPQVLRNESSIFRKTVRLETETRLARIACFLERYRLRHNGYPEKLSDIPDLPSGLDREIVAEAPFVYRKEGASYRLYSVGWNRIDEGGELGKGPQGDWPWAGP